MKDQQLRRYRYIVRYVFEGVPERTPDYIVRYIDIYRKITINIVFNFFKKGNGANRKNRATECLRI